MNTTPTVHFFKLAGQRMALDVASGNVMHVDEITYKMLFYLTAPLPADCPSAIRYDMAKYDSAAVERAYAALYKAYSDGKLYSAFPFDGDARAETALCVPSNAPLGVLDGAGVPVVITDTDDTENARALCDTAKARGLCVTVCMTREGNFIADRLLVPESLYETYQGAADEVGVRLIYDAEKPKLCERLTAWADRGVVWFDFYTEDAAEGEQTALIKEIARVAKELLLRKKEGRAVHVLPIFLCCRGAKHGSSPFCDDCRACTHRMWCGGNRTTEADCNVKRAYAEAAMILS